MFKIGLTVANNGLVKSNRQLKKFAKEFPKETHKVIYGGCQNIARNSKRTYCPIETGNLRSTIKAVNPGKRGNLASEYYVTAGDSSVSYAVIVHEDVVTKKNWTKGGTGPKYIEKPALQQIPKMGKKLKELADKTKGS
jgi:hypothetical protein